MRSLIIAVLQMATVWCLAAPLAHGQVQAWLPKEALSVLASVQTNSPQLAAARARKAAERARADAHEGFYQPRVALSAGGAQGPVAAPESTLFSRITGDAASLQAGVLMPLRVGAYVGAGASQRYLFEADGFENLGQSAVGLRVEVPLLRDRGFRSQRLQQAALEATAEATAERARAIGEALAHEALVRYVGWLYARADVHEYVQSVKRVERLLEETAGRVALKTLAEYQVFTAQMEVSFRQEELRQAQAALTNAGHSLATVLGGVLPDGLFGQPATLRAWASRCATTDVTRLTAAAVPRAEWREALQKIRSAEQVGEARREQMRSSLSLVAGVGYQGEDEDGGLGRDNLLADDQAGAEVALVWSRPLHFDAEAAAVRAQAAEVEAARADLRRIQLAIHADREQARASLEAARDRLGIVDRAVDDARRALDAEMERMRLGEGRSRNVLDAQKDLTTAERRANLAALDMILAYADLLHATGVPLLVPEVSHVAIRTSD
jgi:outer membrane protein TolC